MSINPILKSKIQLYHRQLELQKYLQNKKELLISAKHNIAENSNTARGQMELIKQLSDTQREYYEKFDVTPPTPDPNVYLIRQYKNLIDDLQKSCQIETNESETELAFPFNEEMTPQNNQYTELYDELGAWLTEKERQMDEADAQKARLKEALSEITEHNQILQTQIDQELDLSEEIQSIKEEIERKTELIKSKKDVSALYQQKQDELGKILKKIEETQHEVDSNDSIKVNKETNVQTLTELHLRCLKKWDKLQKLKNEQRIQKSKMRELVSLIKTQFPHDL